MSSLLIHKIGNSFFHVDSLLTEFPMFLGDFWADIENDKFQLNRYAGSSGHEYNFTDVTIQVDSGSIENFTAREDLTNRLKEISYPGIKNFSSGGTIPNLPQVLAVGDRLAEYIGMDVIYSFQLIDRTKNVFSDSNATFVLDGDIAFPDNSVLMFSCPIGTNTLSFINGTTIYFNGAVLTTDLVMPIFSKGYLTCTDAPAKTWILTYEAGSISSGSSAVTSVNAQTGDVILNSDNIGDGTTYKQYSATEKTKLAGIASGATANSSDATLLARANHTGTQTASTISDFNTEVASTASLKSNNLSDLASASTARTNLGLGTLATQSGTFSSKQDNISLTTTGSSGAATFASNTLNVPNYTLSGLGGQSQLSGTGFIKASGTTISYDNSTYLTTSIAASTYAPISTTPIILLNDNTTTSAVTGTTTNTILASYLIPANTFASGDRLIVNFLALKSTAVGTATYRLYINTTNSLIGATQVATFANATGSKFQLMERNISFKSSTTLEVFSSTVGNAYDLGTDTNLPSTITYDTTQAYYLITSVIPTSASDSFTQSRLSVTKFKSKTTF